MAVKRDQSPTELAARALCRFHGLAEDTMFQGKAMWQSYIDEAQVTLRAALSDDEFKRLVGDVSVGQGPRADN